MKEEVIIYSEGTRLAADLFIPDNLKEGEKKPTILLCHGWGGPKSHLSSTYAPHFCDAGFVACTFDYRGWFESDARLITMESQPEVDADGYMTVRAKPVRDVVDPIDQNRDINNVLDYLLERPEVDRSRLGLWGSSYGGGHVVYVAGHDRRIKVVVCQVAPMADIVPIGEEPMEVEALAAAMARGEIDLIPKPEGQPENLSGVGDSRTMRRFHPRQAAANIHVPILILDQEEEEYGGREAAGLAALNALPEKTIRKYHVFPGTHYDIYDKNYKESADMARDWFLEHL